MKLASIILLSFFVLVAYQNCADVSEMDRNTLAKGVDTEQDNDGSVGTDISSGDDNVICQAMAMPRVEIGFLYTNNQAIPKNLEIEINNEVVYSDCNGGISNFIGQRESGRFSIFREYEDNAPYVGYIDVRLSSVNCSNGDKTELLSDSADVNYQPYEVCETESYKLELDYLMSGE